MVQLRIRICKQLIRNEKWPNVKLANVTLETLHGIPPYSDSQKRNIAQDIISHYLEIAGIAFIMPSGDTYFMEPYVCKAIRLKIILLTVITLKVLLP